jgi:predicted PurR-regulated permease PerM
MTLFGTTLDTMAVFSLISMLTLLVYWMFVLRDEKRWLSWFRGWEADRKARRLAEDGSTETPKSSQTSPKKGPWG